MREWLPLLNPRQKRTEAKPNLKIDDVVLVISPDCPRAQWPLGGVLEVFQDKTVTFELPRFKLVKTLL